MSVEDKIRIATEQILKKKEKKVRDKVTISKVLKEKSTCSVCGTSENVSWVGGYQPFLCDSSDCIPF